MLLHGSDPSWFPVLVPFWIVAVMKIVVADPGFPSGLHRMVAADPAGFVGPGLSFVGPVVAVAAWPMTVTRTASVTDDLYCFRYLQLKFHTLPY